LLFQVAGGGSGWQLSGSTVLQPAADYPPPANRQPP